MVRAGQGVGIVNLLAATMVRSDGLEIRPLASPDVFRDVGIWWHGSEPVSRASQVLIEYALAAQRPPGTLPPPPDE
jgi:DNA-binding transcriptional LysR family regulator